MAKVTEWLTANKLSPNTSKTKYMLITNKHAKSDSFKPGAGNYCGTGANLRRPRLAEGRIF